MRVLTLLGVDQVQDDLAATAKRAGILFPCPTCRNEVELLALFPEHNPDAVVIYTRLVNAQLEDVLIQIRFLSQACRIILVTPPKAILQPDILKEYQVYDIVPEKKRLRTDTLIAAISQGALDDTQDSIVLEPIPEGPAITGPSDASPAEPEPAPAAPEPQGQPPPPIYRPKPRLKHTVAGVFGLSHGAGCTSMARTLAEFFALCGLASAAVDLTGTGILLQEEGRAEYFSGTAQDVVHLSKTFDFVAVDFGVIFNVTAAGQFMGLSPGFGPMDAQLLNKCNFKVCMDLLDEPWQEDRIQKLLRDDYWQQLIGNDFVFLFNRQPDIAAAKYTPMYDRNAPKLGYLMSDIFFEEEKE